MPPLSFVNLKLVSNKHHAEGGYAGIVARLEFARGVVAVHVAGLRVAHGGGVGANEDVARGRVNVDGGGVSGIFAFREESGLQRLRGERVVGRGRHRETARSPVGLPVDEVERRAAQCHERSGGYGGKFARVGRDFLHGGGHVGIVAHAEHEEVALRVGCHLRGIEAAGDVGFVQAVLCVHYGEAFAVGIVVLVVIAVGIRFVHLASRGGHAHRIGAYGDVAVNIEGDGVDARHVAVVVRYEHVALGGANGLGF